MRSVIFLFFGILSLGQLSAQTCCSGGVPLSNNLGLPNEGKGSFIVGLNYDYNHLNTLNAGTEKLDDDSRSRNTNSILLNAGYAIDERLSVEALFTWVNQTRTIRQFGNESFTETRGIGDAVFLIKYAFPELLGIGTILNLGLGTKAPFGKSNLTSEEGFQLTADLQPGSGAWDILGWTSISKKLGFRPSATASGSITYRLTAKNNSYLNDSSVYEFGDVLQANVGYTDQFLLFNTVVDPGLILKYRKAFADQIDGSDLPNTGGQWVFVRPELAAQLSKNMKLLTRLELPIYSKVVGTQLTPTLRFTAGISYTFIKNNITLVN